MLKTNQKDFRIEKVIKRKDDKLYVTWKEYNELLKKVNNIGASDYSNNLVKQTLAITQKLMKLKIK